MQNKKSTAVNLLVALIGAAAVIGAAIIGVWGSLRLSDKEIEATLTAEAKLTEKAVVPSEPPPIIIPPTVTPYAPPGFWSSQACPGALVEANNIIQVTLPLKDKKDQECLLKHESSQPEISRVSVTVKLTGGLADRSWLGMSTSCGKSWLNYMLSPAAVAIEGFGVSGRTALEEFSSQAPVARMLVAEWTGAALRLSVIDPATNQVTSQKDLPCTDPPQWLHLGAITNPGGYVEGAISNIEIEFR